jgi:hypothetical protein
VSLRIIVFFFLFFSFSFSMVARGVTFLPVYVNGEVPRVLSSKDQLEYGLAELTAFYASELFWLEPTDFTNVREYVKRVNYNYNKKLDPIRASEICESMESSFIVAGEFLFSDSVSVITEVYSCNGQLLSHLESSFATNFYTSLEQHVKKTFVSFPAKPNRFEDQKHSELSELIFAIDTSGSFMKEAKEAKAYIQRYMLSSDSAIGLLLMSEKRTRFYPPTTDKEQVEKILDSINFGGKLVPAELVSSLYKIKVNEKEAGFSRKLIIMTDSKITQDSSGQIILALKSFKEAGYATYLITGPSSPPLVSSEYARIAGFLSTQLLRPVTSVRFGTTKGFRTLYLKDNKVYMDRFGRKYSPEIKVEELDMIEDSLVYSKVEYPHQGNLSQIFSAVSKEKIIEAEAPISTISTLIDESVRPEKGYYARSNKILLKSGKTSVWINANKPNKEIENKFVVIKTRFVKDAGSSSGFASVAENTEVYTNNVPKLLVLKPSEITKYFQTSGKRELVCFLEGSVLETK